MWGFPKIRGTFLGVPIIRTIVYWGLYWGTLYFGKLPYIYIYICIRIGVLWCRFKGAVVHMIDGFRVQDCSSLNKYQYRDSQMETTIRTCLGALCSNLSGSKCE